MSTKVSGVEGTLVDEYISDGIGFITRCARRHGDVVPLPFHVGKRVFWVLSHPAAIQEVLTRKASSFRKGQAYRRAKAAIGEGLFTADGEIHRRHRKLATPFFQAGEIRRYGDVMIRLAEEVVSGWSEGQSIDVCGEMSRLTLTVVARSLFGADLLAAAPELAGTIGDLLALLHERTRPIEVGQLHADPDETRRFAELRSSFDQRVLAMIKERRATRGQGDDLLGKLLSAQDEGLLGLDDHEVRDEIVTLLISGHDTTGVTISFALRLLAENPEVRDEVEREVDRVLGDRPITLDDAPKLERLGQVFDETLRLFPPVWMLAREALADVELPGQTVRKGDSVGISLFVVHRDPRWWSEPDAFRPDRFSPQATPPQPWTYLPFGAGTRTCIGRSFAELEGILVLAAVVRRARLDIDTSAEPRLLPHMLLRPEGGIAATVRLRG